MKYYHIWTIGCQMNTADSRRLADELEKLGYACKFVGEGAAAVVPRWFVSESHRGRITFGNTLRDPIGAFCCREADELLPPPAQGVADQRSSSKPRAAAMRRGT